MTFDELLVISPTVIRELATEFVRRGDECLNADKESQLTACIFLINVNRYHPVDAGTCPRLTSPLREQSEKHLGVI